MNLEVTRNLYLDLKINRFNGKIRTKNQNLKVLIPTYDGEIMHEKK